MFMKKTVIFSLFLFLALSVFIASPVLAAKCLNEKPDRAPDLFQINATKNSATLYFTPVNNAITNYTIIYGYKRGEERFGVSFPFGQYDGVINYTIKDLSPNTRYFFKVRADNDCRRGYWSDTMSVQTNWELKIYTRVKGDWSSSNFYNKASATPTGGFVSGIAPGFAPGVLGVATPSATLNPSVTPQVLGNSVTTTSSSTNGLFGLFKEKIWGVLFWFWKNFTSLFSH